MKSARRQDGLAKPQHPLPKEIQEMKRDETVCQFCGVSYLIHNEIKKLEDEIIKLKAEIERYNGFDKREADFKKMLADEKLKNEQMEADLQMEKSRSVWPGMSIKWSRVQLCHRGSRRPSKAYSLVSIGSIIRLGSIYYPTIQQTLSF